MTTTILGILAAVFAGTTAWLWMNRGKQTLDANEASKAVKSFAENNKVRIELTDDQMAALIDGYTPDPEKPARLTFYANGKPKIQFDVAGYSYSGDTCCV